MKKIFAVLLLCLFTVSMHGFAVKKGQSGTKSSSKEVTVKQLKGLKFTTDKNKVKQTRLLQNITYENTKKNSFTDEKQKQNRDVTSPQHF